MMASTMRGRFALTGIVDRSDWCTGYIIANILLPLILRTNHDFVGAIGNIFCHKALAQGNRLTVFAPSPGKLSADLQNNTAVKVIGEMKDRAGLEGLLNAVQIHSFRLQAHHEASKEL
jgi:hypothetical protein